METPEVITREEAVCRSTSAPGLSIEGAKLRGYAVVYGSPTAAPARIGSSWAVEIIDRGAFDASIGSQNIPFTFNHVDIAEYGDTASGSLRLSADERGIAFELDLPPYASVLREAIETGHITGMSFGFVSPALEMRNGVRHIVRAVLTHISPVFSPAYPATTVKIVEPVRHGTRRRRLELLDKL